MEGDTPTALLDLVASFLGPCETPASSVAEYDHVVVIDGKKKRRREISAKRNIHALLQTRVRHNLQQGPAVAT